MSSVIDLKQTQVLLQDGFGGVAAINTVVKSGAINHSGGYATGASTMVIDGVSGIMQVGDTFTVGGDPTTYTITAHSETAGNTTSITFTPTLAADYADNAVVTGVAHVFGTSTTTLYIDGYDGVLAPGDTFTIAGDDTIYTVVTHFETGGDTTKITISPGLVDAAANNAVITLLPHSLEMKIGEGNLTYTEKKNRIYIRNRGLLDGIKDGDQEPMDVSFDIMWEHLISASGEPILPNEAIQRIGAAANWTSSSDDPCEPYAINIVLIYTPLCPDVDIEKITLEDFRWETLDHSTKDGTISAKGTCNHSTALVERISA